MFSKFAVEMLIPEIVNQDGTLSAWGKALKAAFDRAKNDGYMKRRETIGEAEEAIFMAFELIRLDILNTSQFFPSPPYSGAPIRGTDTDKAFTLLLSRVAALGTFRHEEIGFTGPLSRHLLAYHQMTAAVRGSLRDLVEMHAVSMLLSGVASRNMAPKAYTDLGCSLPFAREPDLGLSLVVKSYLDELSNDPSRRSDIQRWFSHAVDIQGDLQKAWKMWAAVSISMVLNGNIPLANKPGRSMLASRPQKASSNLTSRLCSTQLISGWNTSWMALPLQMVPHSS